MGENSAYYREKARKTREKIDAVKKQLPQYTHSFIEECLLKYQINTVYVYVHDLQMFFTYLQEKNSLCQDRDLKDIPFDVLDSLNAYDINEFQNYLSYGGIKSRQGEKPRAIARKMTSVRNFFNYMERMDIMDHNPTTKAAKKRKEIENEIFRLDADEVKQLIDAVSKVFVKNHHSKVLSEMTAKRDLAIIMLLLGTGIRVSECVGLDIGDVDFRNDGIRIIRKGGSESIVYFGEEVERALKAWIEERKSILPVSGHEQALFYSTQKKRMGVQAVENMVKKYAREVTTTKKITPHKLRSTYGTSLYRETGDIYLVADVLGHKDVNTTKKHYAAMDDNRRRRAAGAVRLRETP